MDDPQLRAQLAVGSGGVDLAEAVLPEATTHRQERVVVDNDAPIFNRLADSRALELTRHLAGMLIQQ